MIWEITAALSVFVLTLWIRWRQKILKTFQNMGVPGPPPNILFGNMFELYWKGPIKCHEEWIKKYGKIVGFYFGMRPVILIADEDCLKQVQIKEFQSFTDRPNSLFQFQDNVTIKGTHHLINQRGKEWKETRSLLSPAFTSGKLKQMSPLMISAVDLTMELVKEKASTKKEFDIYPLWQGLTADVIGRTAFGIDAEVQRDKDHPLIRSARVFFAETHFQSLLFLLGFSFKEFGKFFFFVRQQTLTIRNKMEEPIAKLTGLLEEVIKYRRSNNVRRKDLLQSLLDAEKVGTINNIDVHKLTAENDSTDESELPEKTTPASGKTSKKGSLLSDEEVKSNAFLMYIAGYETTSTTLGFTSYALVRHPDVQERLRLEVQQLFEEEGELSPSSVLSLPYMDQVFNESLRMYSPIFLFVNREAVKDVKIGAINIPKGMAVQIPVFWLHHSSEYWDNADDFIPSRFENDNIAKSKLMWQPFGAGPRNCIGMRFALMEAKLAIAKLLLNFRLEPSKKTEKGNISVRDGLFIRSPVQGVFVKAVPLKN